MSDFYNLMYGEHNLCDYATTTAHILNIQRPQGFVDAWPLVHEEHLAICVMTRRWDGHFSWVEESSRSPAYILDEVDPSDCNYHYIVFRSSPTEEEMEGSQIGDLIKPLMNSVFRGMKERLEKDPAPPRDLSQREILSSVESDL